MAPRLFSLLLLLATACVASLADARMLPFPLGLHAQRVSSSHAASAPSKYGHLPVFFFHGVTANARSGYHFVQNLTAEGRVVTALDFCQDECSTEALPDQVPLAIAQIRADIAKNPSAYRNGYIFIGHSQGGALSRAVIEEMDDHNVKLYISLAGAQNGIFYGPQPADRVPLLVYANGFGAQLIPHDLFDFSHYTPADYNGKIQYDMTVATFDHPEGQKSYSGFNLARSPVHDRWVSSNPFLPVINNINPCESSDKECVDAKARRRANFLKLEVAHFFISPEDGVISPWQTSIFGQYNDVEKEIDVLDKFKDLKILDMKLTLEYKEDTYGLRTLDERGGLFRHVLPDVTHTCWVIDSASIVTQEPCYFQPIYDEHLYPLLV
jgi:palmitoyl-protein thioesterase